MLKRQSVAWRVGSLVGYAAGDDNMFSQTIRNKTDAQNHRRTPANANYILKHCKDLTPLETRELQHVAGTSK